MHSHSSLFTLPWAGIEPRFRGPLVECGTGAAVLGRATLGFAARLGPFSVVRADGHSVTIGDEFLLGSRGTVHIAHEVYPTVIGDRVAVGTFAVVHACTVGSDCVIEDRAVILDGSVVEDDVVLASDSVVFPRSHLKGGFLYSGRPAAPVRPLASGEAAERRRRMAAAFAAHEGEAVEEPADLGGWIFAARTALLRGSVHCDASSSIWFGCRLDAGTAAIDIGENSNIQDNSLITCRTGQGVVIGRNSTLGHNVQMEDCEIGSGTLIGIGSVVARGTVVEDDVLLAAGGRTLPGQRLERGWLWGGSPARPLSKLNDDRRRMISIVVEQYCGYARDFKRAQAAALSRRAATPSRKES